MYLFELLKLLMIYALTAYGLIAEGCSIVLTFLEWFSWKEHTLLRRQSEMKKGVMVTEYRHQNTIMNGLLKLELKLQRYQNGILIYISG